MKKLNSLFLIVIIILSIVLSGCGKKNGSISPSSENPDISQNQSNLQSPSSENSDISQNQSNLQSKSEDNSNSNLSNDSTSSQKKSDWEKEPSKFKYAYQILLEELYADKGSDHILFDFAFKDIDNNGIDEMLFTRNGVDLTIYTFNNKTIEVGNHNFKNETIRFLYSDNPSYPGIIYFTVDSELENYGYITIKNDKLTFEELWNNDYSGVLMESGKRNDRILEIHPDKKLINESKISFNENKDIKFISLNNIFNN